VKISENRTHDDDPLARAAGGGEEGIQLFHRFLRDFSRVDELVEEPLAVLKPPADNFQGSRNRIHGLLRARRAGALDQSVDRGEHVGFVQCEKCFLQ